MGGSAQPAGEFQQQVKFDNRLGPLADILSGGGVPSRTSHQLVLSTPRDERRPGLGLDVVNHASCLESVLSGRAKPVQARLPVLVYPRRVIVLFGGLWLEG